MRIKRALPTRALAAGVALAALGYGLQAPITAAAATKPAAHSSTSASHTTPHPTPTPKPAPSSQNRAQAGSDSVTDPTVSPNAAGGFGFSWQRPATGQTTAVPATYTHQPAPKSKPDLPRGTGAIIHSATTSLVFWQPTGQSLDSTPAGDAAYKALQQRWVQDAGATAYSHLLTQYYDDAGHISDSISLGGTYVDTTAYPHAGTQADPLTDADIHAEVARAAKAKGWAEDESHIIAVFTPRGVEECFDSSTCTDSPQNAFCAYHQHFDDNGNDALYAYMYEDDSAPGCDIGNGTSPNNDEAADSEVSTLSHEVFEAITDPHPFDAWTFVDSAHNIADEIGDKCAYNTTPQSDTGADVYLNGHPYIVQQEWSNAVHTCAIDGCPSSTVTDVCAPAVSGTEVVDNPNPVIGSTVTYTVTITNSSDTGAATNLTINGPMPNGYTVTNVQATCSPTAKSFTPSAFTVSYDTLPVHQTQTITVQATVPNQVGQPASACSNISLQNLLSVDQPAVATSPCGGTTPGKIPTSIAYNGPTTADYHDGFTASAAVTGGGPVSGGTVTFTLGGASCTAPATSGSASCGLTPVDPAGGVTLHADYSGDGTHLASSTTAGFTITKEETTVAYTGPKHVANGVPATLSGVLKEDGTAPIAGRQVRIALGTGASEQDCTGTTDGSGNASCTITTVDQPLTDAATVPVALAFDGDAYYRPSNASATVRLEYYTGRSYGLSANVDLLLAQLSIPPTPDTGPIRIAKASSTTTPCSVSLNTLLINADALCANVTTTLAPGTSRATATAQDVSIGIPGIPVIGISGLTATSVSSCTGTSGSATLTLTIAGVPVTVPTAPNSVIGLAGGAQLVINEQTPVPGADFGTTVNAVHLTLPGLLGGNAVDVVVGSATSDAHNCS